MKTRFLLVAALTLVALILTACTDSAATPDVAPRVVETPDAPLPQVPLAESEAPETAGTGGATAAETLVDEQGAVAVSITPLNLGVEGATLDFEIALNTHSVDLSMDLAQMATLSTDTGTTVAAATWDAPTGGHHVSGVLSFPATSEGAAVLEGATTVILTVENLDTATRTFTWRVN